VVGLVKYKFNKEGLMENAERVAELIERCKKGNLKLNIAWRQLRDSAAWHTPELQDMVEEWSQKTGLLGRLGEELKAKGFTTCLYINEDGIKTRTCAEKDGLTCWACPSEFKYWEAEIFGGPVPGEQIQLDVK